MEKNLLDDAERTRGKFRTFLLVTLDRYVVSQHRKMTAMRRSPERPTEELRDDAVTGGSGDDPSVQFNVAWARETIAEALRRMEADCIREGRPEVWGIFYARIIQPLFEASEPMPYDELVQTFNLATPLQACNLLTTGKRTFSRHLLSVAGEYSRDESEAVSEVEQLRELLAGLRAESAGPPRR